MHMSWCFIRVRRSIVKSPTLPEVQILKELCTRLEYAHTELLKPNWSINYNIHAVAVNLFQRTMAWEA